MAVKQGLINHVALVLDASLSMHHLREKVIQVADEQIAYLARRSKELDQETRVTVYTFSGKVECLVYDKDVLRLPSIREHYRPGGCTALIDATLRSQEDLAHTWEGYGDHSFLTFILSDGQENSSRRHPRDLARHLQQMPSHWTVAVLVPDQIAKHEAKRFGFPAENIAIWDASSTHGLEEAANTIQTATETFMANRSAGIRGSRSVFSTGADAVNSHTIKNAGLTPLNPSQYQLLNVTGPSVTRSPKIKDWVEKEARHRYTTGCSYYQLTKRENIQPQKKIAVLEEKDEQGRKIERIYTGPEARALLGLGDIEVRVSPDQNPDYSIFVQSTSVNRKLVPGTKLLLMP